MENKASKLKIFICVIGKILKWTLLIVLGLFIFLWKLLLDISKDY